MYPLNEISFSDTIHESFYLRKSQMQFSNSTLIFTSFILVIPAKPNAPFDGLSPSIALFGSHSFCVIRRRIEFLLDFDLIFDFFKRVPKIDMESSGYSRSDSRDFLFFLTDNRSIGKIRLHLHHKIIDGHATIDGHF